MKSSFLATVKWAVHDTDCACCALQKHVFLSVTRARALETRRYASVNTHTNMNEGRILE